MSNKLKRIVEEIQKLAQSSGAAPPPPAGAVIVQGPGGPPQPQGGGGGSYQVVGPIKDMQEAMQQFAAVATTYGSAKQQSVAPGQPKLTAAVDSRKKKFNDFITEQYLANADMKGEEFTPDEKRTAKDQKLPTDLIEMNIVVNGLQRIGGAQSELKSDNFWDFRTNNALKNIYAFAHGLVNLAKDFGRTDAQSFTEQDLAKMRELIPEDRDPAKLPNADKINKAKQLTTLIKKLTRFYKYYIDNVAMHPGFTRFIAGNENMLTLEKGGGDPTALNRQEQSLMPSIDTLQLGSQAIPNITNKPGFEINFPSPKGVGGVIGLGSMPVQALQNMNTFRAFMTSMGFQQNQTGDPRYMKAALDAVMKHIDAVLALPEAQEKSAPAQSSEPVPSTQAGPTGTPNQSVKNV